MPSISPSIWLAGKLTKRADLSARNVWSLNRSSNSVRKVSIDSCILQTFCPQSPSLVLKTISLVIGPLEPFPIYFHFPYFYHFHCGRVKRESRRWMAITQCPKKPEANFLAKTRLFQKAAVWKTNWPPGLLRFRPGLPRCTPRLAKIRLRSWAFQAVEQLLLSRRRRTGWTEIREHFTLSWGLNSSFQVVSKATTSWGCFFIKKSETIVPIEKPANRLNLLNISGIYHKLIPLGKQNPKNLFEEVSHTSLPGNPVLVRVPQNPFEKKIPSEPTSPPSQNSATNFKTENSNPYPPMKSFLFSPG